jgi:hypothetical protein
MQFEKGLKALRHNGIMALISLKAVVPLRRYAVAPLFKNDQLLKVIFNKNHLVLHQT